MPARAVLVALILLCFPHFTPAALPDEQELHRALAGRLAKLQSLIVEYNLEETATPPGPPQPPLKAPGGSLVLKRGLERTTERFAFLNGTSRLEKRYSPETIQKWIDDKRIPALENILYHRANKLQRFGLNAKEPGGSIEESPLPPFMGYLPIALGLREDGLRNGWWTPSTLKTLKPDRE